MRLTVFFMALDLEGEDALGLDGGGVLLFERLVDVDQHGLVLRGEAVLLLLVVDDLGELLIGGAAAADLLHEGVVVDRLDLGDLLLDEAGVVVDLADLDREVLVAEEADAVRDVELPHFITIEGGEHGGLEAEGAGVRVRGVVVLLEFS
jgi:hypothetical protein